MFRSKKGTVIPLFALLLTVIIGLGAVVVDVSQSYSIRTRIKSAIDQAALAGTSQLVGPSSVSNAKNLTLQYLNDNLTMTISSFAPLTLNSEGLSIQAGIYNFNNMSFTWDEVNSNVNAIMVSYTYNSMTYLGSVFMVGNVQILDNSTVAKRSAIKALPGTGFPFVIYTTVLSDVVNNMVTLYSASGMDNSYWTDYTLGNPSTNEITNIINYFQYGMGTVPPGVNVSDTFTTNDGGMGAVFMNMDPNVLVGMTYLFSLVTPTMSNQVIADGFVAATINSIMDTMAFKSIDITITPGYIDNTFGGLQLGSGTTNVAPSLQQFLANAYGLVQ